MKNLIRNVWVCLGLMVLPFTASGQQKDNITYAFSSRAFAVTKQLRRRIFHRVDTAKYYTMPPDEETIHKLCRSGYLFYNK